jgi:SagB-type dehydrogenase family enzyme
MRTGKRFLLLTLLIVVSLITFQYSVLLRAEMQDKEPTIGERFHYETSLTWRDIVGDLIRNKPEKPVSFKTYPNAQITKLPKPEYRGMALEEAMAKRRSVRNYSSRPLSLAQLSQLLFSAQGATGKIYRVPLRTAPSAGALFPFEIYLVVNNVQDLPQGIYHYAFKDHALELIKIGDFRQKITSAGLKQEMLGEADVTFVLSAVFNRVRHKYGERGFRYTYIEAGHIGQNISLQAVSLGLGSVGVGAFLDKKVNELIGVDGRQEAAIYLHAVGTL